MQEHGVSGFYRSLDFGETWELGQDPFYSKYILDIFCNEAGDIYVLEQYKGIYRSSDLGDSWTLINNGLTSIKVRALTFNSDGKIFAATADGVFKSSNNGDDWIKSNNGITDSNIVDIAVHPTGYIFAITTDSVFLSIDNGGNWGQLMIEEYLYNTCINIKPNGHIFISEGPGWNYGVFRSTDVGDTWTQHIQGFVEKTSIGEMVFDTTGRIYAITGGGLYYSDTDGDTWNPRNNGLKATTTNDMICSKNNYIILTNQYGIFRSGDQGATWTHTLDRTHQDGVESITLDPKSGKIYACQSFYGFYVSDDDGETWNGIKMQEFIYKEIEGSAINSQGHFFVLVIDHGVVRSTDDGNTWDQFENDLTNVRTGPIIIDSEDIIYVASGGVYRSDDNGETWTEFSSGLELNSAIMDFEIDKDGVLYAANYNGEVYWTNNKGESWQQITENGNWGANLSDLAISKNGDLLTASSYGAFYLQKNSDKWNMINKGLVKNPHVENLAIDSSGYIYAGVMGNSVFRTTFPTSSQQIKFDHPYSNFLDQNYPNPFYTETVIPYELRNSVIVSLIIYNSLGIEISRYNYGRQDRGNYSVRFNAGTLPAGAYYYNLEFDGIPTNTCKMFLLR